ncbi:short-chain dehydrogenase [Cylindrobasidium torrendii FP15055 ss-10]|uniref:Short-chain dehydrogenase n=1 Tax=Cylindrobasidium torrendii FP15055 ss-10 TaxID=1314674 RepID=A0A0D7BNJ0_9AGAR|nr:short-chain dehydrogenase [Cylindrobasidium torrendii FP15055 ss-10]
MPDYAAKGLFDLNGFVAVVTGGGTGIGLHIARGLAENGAKVYITGRRLEVLQKAAGDNNVKGSIIPLCMDVTSKDSILEAKKVIEEKDGKLHILINNAGQVGPTSNWFNSASSPERQDAESIGSALFQESEQAWSDIYAINTHSIFFVSTAFLGLLDKGSQETPGYTSTIVNVTSISGLMKLAQEHFAYNSSKAAASALTKLMATEFALKGVQVRVNAVAPGVYESEMTIDQISPEQVDKIGKGLSPVPAKRPGTGQEVAATVLYLASQSGCYMNGQELVIDGGYLCVNP